MVSELNASINGVVDIETSDAEGNSLCSSSSGGESFLGFENGKTAYREIDLEFSVDYRFSIDVRI